MNQRQLIVNADDFGASEEVNEAIIRAYKEGVLTSASLMVTGDAFEQAVRLAKENPGLADWNSSRHGCWPLTASAISDTVAR